MKIKIIVIRTAGTNCDRETAHAFDLAGGSADLVHINELARGEKRLADYQILAIPGGFTYGDDIASGKILANELKFKIGDNLRSFIGAGKLIIGICNGFQVLVKSGLLPNIDGKLKTIEATLTLNESAKFEDRWVRLKAEMSNCIWTKGITGTIMLPVAHGEGNFIPRDRSILKALAEEGQIALRYCDSAGKRVGYPGNPNGSVGGIAGICDKSGRIFGLMPHPERHISYLQHPYWTKNKPRPFGDGFTIFSHGVNFAKKHL